MSAKSIIRQVLIFLSYLLLCSLVLFNHKGGADLLFMLLMTVSITVHILLTFIIIFKTKTAIEAKRWTSADMFACLSLTLLFIVFHNYYLEFMWWLTNLIKHN